MAPRFPPPLQIYVDIVDSDPAIWRRLRVPGQLPLQALHPILQAAMGWQNCQPYRFKPAVAEETPLAQVLRLETPELFYLYDLRDGWLHRVQLEQGSSPAAGPSLTCLEGAMACPPESCGGVWGYEELLERLNDPDDPEYVDLWDRIGGDFDPAYFDLGAANQRIAALALTT